MIIKISLRPRMTGKTTELIEISAKTGWVIVCAKRDMCHMTKIMARDMGKKIIDPISVDQLLDTNRNTGRHPDGENKEYNGYLIDDANSLINKLISKYTGNCNPVSLMINDLTEQQSDYYEFIKDIAKERVKNNEPVEKLCDNETCMHCKNRNYMPFERWQINCRCVNCYNYDKFEEATT